MKVFKFIYIVLVLTIVAHGVSAQGRWIKRLRSADWLSAIVNIVPMKSTKDDLIVNLGPPVVSDNSGSDFIKYYMVDNARITATFTSTVCQMKSGNAIPVGVLEEISLEPEKLIRFSALKVPLAKFRRSRDNDAPSIETFKDDNDGIEIEVQKDRVTYISFTAPKRDGVKCKD